MTASTLAARRFTVDEYYRMAKAGILGPDDRVELLEGIIVEMPPIGSGHALCVDRLARLFHLALAPDQAWVRVQHPIRLSDVSEPEPDLVLALGPSDRYASQHPAPDEVLLVTEVGVTSVLRDRRRKLPLYAAAGIREVWLIDVTRGRVEVCREPGPEGYASRTIAGRDGVIAPAAFPDVSVVLGGVLPHAGR